MTGSLASVHPELIPEWSEKNLPLTPDITLATKLTDVINETMNDPTVGILHHDEGVDLVPANLELSAMEFNLVNAMSRETALRNYLSEVKDKYDYTTKENSHRNKNPMAFLFDFCKIIGFAM